MVYVNNIVVSEGNEQGISELKAYMGKKFHMKDLGLLKFFIFYFFGREIARSRNETCLHHGKYDLELIAESGLLSSTPSVVPIEENVKLTIDDYDVMSQVNKDDYLIEDLWSYQRLLPN